MRLSIPMPGAGIKEEVIEHYLKNFTRIGRVPDAEKSRFADELLRASRVPMNGTYDFQGNYFGCLRWYRAKYVSLADAAGHVYRIVGRLDDITDIWEK